MKTYAEYRKQVEEALSGQLRSLGEIPDILLTAMEYSLLAGGKRLRAVLLLASCEAIGGDTGKALPFACALEMIHTYSLIHDDLPAMDNDDLRRGQLTNHRKFGEDVAILAGDGLLSAAMELMARQAAKLAKVGDCSGVLAMEAIARHAGVTGMVAGQTMDVTSEGAKPTADKVRYIHLHKTADLLTAPVEAGLLLAGATQDQVQYGCEYGQHLGMAFQMVDDLLDVIGTEEALGKSVGKDVAEEKLTWIAIRGIEGTREEINGTAQHSGAFQQSGAAVLHHGVVRGAGAQNSDVLSGRKEMGLAPLFRQRGNAVEPYGVRRLPDADDWRDAGLRQRDFRPVFHDGGDCHVRCDGCPPRDGQAGGCHQRNRAEDVRQWRKHHG